MADPFPTKSRPGAGSYKQHWRKRFTWLRYDKIRQHVTCASCCEAQQRGLLGGVTKRDDAFMSRGFDSWRKANERFTRHENSNCHREAVKRLTAAGSLSSTSTSTMLLTANQKEQQDNRVALRHIYHAIIVLSAQGLALRRREENTGNLRRLLHTMALESPAGTVARPAAAATTELPVAGDPAAAGSHCCTAARCASG